MPIELTWLGHGGWSIATGGHTILLDPYVNDSPVATCKAEELIADFILLSHGHFDHVNDVPEIAKRTRAQVITNFEIGTWLAENYGIEGSVQMNPGGGVQMPFGHVKFTPAIHSSGLPDGSYGGVPGGFLLTLPEATIYFACDTALFSDMQLIGAAGLDLAVVPIGDLFTMGVEDSIAAVNYLQPRQVAPAHYNTWPPIAQDAAAWAERVKAETAAEPLVPEVGKAFRLR